MLGQLVQHRRIVWLLALRNIQDRYTGTLGGALWAILNPLLQLLVFWFVFGVGLRMQSDAGQPFVLFLFCGLIPWMTFNEILTSSASCITSRAYLVKKIAFPMEVLPSTHLIAALFTHCIMLVILGVMLIAYEALPGMGLLLLPYYLFALCALAAGLSMLLAAAAVFFRDVLQGLGVVLNIWFWVTPIVWPPTMAARSLQPLLDYNPAYYVVAGFRDSLLSQSLVLPDPVQSVYFWAVVVVLWIAGVVVFTRLKPSFADVL
jgi:lipopolysaccharide transport system permease protein/teichoic acid transport system permease protein